jgi:putative FmdB family regulatory protein
MPLYEYECKKCHHRFERIVKYSDAPMKKCPDCGGPVEQTITAPVVRDRLRQEVFGDRIFV